MISNLFDYLDYKKYVRARIEALPKRGHGEYRRIAQALRMHTTWVSQIFGGEKELSFEHACVLAEYFGLSELETDYFLKLVQVGRAGTDTSRNVLKRQLEQLRQQGSQVASRLPRAKSLSEAEQAIFYSSWQYSAISLAVGSSETQTVETLATRFDLSRARVRQVLDFLLSVGIVKGDGGRLSTGIASTHVDSTSPLVARHHMNWRVKALEHLEGISTEELAFTAPLTLSPKDFPKVRAILLKAIEEIAKKVSDSGSEELACLNIDWIRLKETGK